MRRRVWWIALLALAATGTGGFFLFRPGSAKSQEPEWRTEVVHRGRMRVKIREIGWLEPLVSVNVKSNVEGEIREIYVREGDRVEAGQVLIKLDDKQIREEKNQAEANLRSAEAERERARRNVTLTEIRQQAALRDAEDRVAIAKAALEAVRKSSEQQLSAAQIELINLETALEQDRIALNQAEIALRQARLNQQAAQSRLESARVAYQNAEAELRRTEQLYQKQFVTRSALEQAQQAFAAAKAQYEQAEQDLAAAEEAVNSAQETVAARQAAVSSREKNMEYQRQNLEILKASRDAAEQQAELELQTAERNLDRLRESYQAEIENSRSALAVAEANYLRAESALNNANERLEWTNIRAPMSGTVTVLAVEEGEIVQSGRAAFGQGPAIMTIADLSQMVVKTYINEVDIPKIQVGQPVEIFSDAYRGRVFPGRVKEISPQGQPQDNVTKFEVVIEVVGSPPELRPGMNVDVDIIVADREDVVQLPIETLIEKTKLIANLRLPREVAVSLQEGQRIALESRVGKRYPARVAEVHPDAEETAVALVEDNAPKGLRVGDHLMRVVLNPVPEDQRQKLSPEEVRERETVVDDVGVRVESERRQLVLVQDESAPGDQKKEGWFLARWVRKLVGREKATGPPPTREKPIRIGLRSDTAFEVLEGLQVGDEVIVPRLDQLVTAPM
ncbi:MAG: hypothetical protein KatS3mg115_2323 [Candidatus Poribacteria bacterium]|nr:MAG: hypothetical protein KatS3mg115_2323 [Candidatus Poribacteria bacterium]